ncbi:MAG: DUF5996 family protein [Thermoanaerobaculia bacterium]
MNRLGKHAMNTWPELSYEAWRDTLETLHLWTQIVGKVRLVHSPWINHSWHATFYPTARGLTTGPIPHGSRVFEMQFDFVRHLLRVQTAEGEERHLALEPRSVASFYEELMERLRELDLATEIHPRPNELPDPITPFLDDTAHASYDPEYANRFGRVLLQAHRVFTWFRSGFCGKVSPVHFFWGSFDLAVTRFSGRPAPPHPGGVPNLPDPVTREAYSYEVSSAGFWPGNAMVPYAAFYSYAYPTPAGFREAVVEPRDAVWSEELGEFLLPYEAVRDAGSPDEILKRFLETTYEAAAELGGWDRERLECERTAPTA